MFYGKVSLAKSLTASLGPSALLFIRWHLTHSFFRNLPSKQWSNLIFKMAPQKTLTERGVSLPNFSGLLGH